MMDDLEVGQVVRVIWSHNPNIQDTSGTLIRVTPSSATFKNDQDGRTILLTEDDDWEVIG